MKPQQKRIKEVIKLYTKKNIKKVPKKKCAHESCPCVIPNEIIFSQILPRLPFKFLCKLKCVSKEWCHIISYEPHFMLQQSCCISAVPGSYVCLDGNTLCIIPTCGNPAGIPDPSLMASLRDSTSCSYALLVASTNGLLCFMHNHLFIVCNPATRESELIHYYIKADYDDVIGRGYGLAFDPSAIPASYKMVQLLLKPCPSTSKILCVLYIYYSDIGRWIESKVHVSITFVEKNYENFMFKKSVSVGGVIYWKLSHDLLSYDLEKDVANTLPLPRANAEIYFEEIGQCGGCATLTRIIGITTLDFWMLLGYGHNPKWELMQRVSLEGSPVRILQPLPCNNDEKMIYVYTRGFHGEYKLMFYDIKGGKFDSCGSFIVNMRRNWIFSYNNSLVALPRKDAKKCPSPDLSKSTCFIA